MDCSSLATMTTVSQVGAAVTLWIWTNLGLLGTPNSTRYVDLVNDLVDRTRLPGTNTSEHMASSAIDRRYAVRATRDTVQALLREWR